MFDYNQSYLIHILVARHVTHIQGDTKGPFY